MCPRRTVALVKRAIRWLRPLRMLPRRARRGLLRRARPQGPRTKKEEEWESSTRKGVGYEVGLVGAVRRTPGRDKAKGPSQAKEHCCSQRSCLPDPSTVFISFLTAVAISTTFLASKKMSELPSILTPSSSGPPVMAPQYVMPIPMPGSPGTPHFDGNNATEFLRKWEDMCDVWRGLKEDRMKRLPLYCDKTIRDLVETMDLFLERDWDQFCKDLKKEYCNCNVDVLLYSKPFLQCYKSKARTDRNDICQYCRQYASISGRLEEKGMLDGYTRSMWFLEGLPSDMQRRVIQKCKIDDDDALSVRFKKMYKEVLAMLATNDTVNRVDPSPQSNNSYSALVDEYKKASTAKAPEVGSLLGAYQAPIAQPAATPAPGANKYPAPKSLAAGDGVNEIMRLMEKMVLPVMTKMTDSLRPLEAAVRTLAARPVPTNAQVVTVGTGIAGPPLGARPQLDLDQCGYCLQKGHYRRRCPEIEGLVRQGKVHLNEQGRLCYGTAGSNGPEMILRRGIPQNEAVKELLDQQGSTQNQPVAVRAI